MGQTGRKRESGLGSHNYARSKPHSLDDAEVAHIGAAAVLLGVREMFFLVPW